MATASGTSSPVKAEGGAISLDVPETLAVVALLGLSSARQWAIAGLMVGLLAVIAEPVRRGASIGVVAKLTTLVAGATRDGRHDGL